MSREDSKHTNGCSLLPSQDDGHCAMRCDVSNGVGNLVKTFLDVSGYGEDVTNIAESLYDGRDKRHRV